MLTPPAGAPCAGGPGGGDAWSDMAVLSPWTGRGPSRLSVVAPPTVGRHSSVGLGSVG